MSNPVGEIVGGVTRRVEDVGFGSGAIIAVLAMITFVIMSALGERT